MSNNKNTELKLLQNLIQGFFLSYMTQQRNASRRTISSYRDCFRLYFKFLDDVHNVPPEKAGMEHLRKEYISGFMKYLQQTRHCSENTINQRVSALKSFLKKYVAYEAPEYIQTVRMIQAIPPIKFERKVMCFITKSEYQSMLEACNKDLYLTERDKVILVFLYNTGCRISELVNVHISDFRCLGEKHCSEVLLHGKGRKERVVPLWNSTSKVIASYIKRNELQPSDSLIISNTGRPMTRSGIGQRIAKLVDVASETSPTLKEKNVTPHTFRHSVAMNMLQSGVSLVAIAIYLGHESIETTNKYIVSDIEMKKKALGKTQEIIPEKTKYRPSPSILKFLAEL